VGNQRLTSDGTAAGNSGFAALGIGTQTINVTGNVFRLAQPVVDTTPLLMVGRVGGGTLQATIGVTNNAPDSFTERLNASIASAPSGTTVGPALLGLVPNASGNLQLSLPTTTAGIFTGLASVASTSQNADMADLTLAPVGVTLQGQVNNLAQVALAKSGGGGSFSGTAFSYSLDFGTVFSGGSSLTAQLVLGNAAAGTADALAGSWNLGTGSAFSVAGFGPFSGLAAGTTLGGLRVTFDLGTEGVFERVLVLGSLSTNGSGPDLSLGDVTLQLQGSVVAVPEPSIYMMMAIGVLAIGSIARRRLRVDQA